MKTRDTITRDLRAESVMKGTVGPYVDLGSLEGI